MKKSDVIKASATIQSEGALSLLQRKTWNVLLANAYDELPEKEIFTIKLAELESILGFNSKNTEAVKDTLLQLKRFEIQWNILKKDKEVWGASSPLADFETEEGVLSYSFPGLLKKKLHNPDMYARINLAMQKKLGSKYSLTIYELCTDYYNSDLQESQTPWIELETFRVLMGVEAKEYQEFKYLNLRTIKDPISEINKKTDITIEAEYKKEKKKVKAIKFKIKHKPGAALTIPKKNTEPDLFNSALFEKLKSLDIPESKALEILKNFNQDKTAQWIECIEGGYIPNIKNKAGYLFAALEQNFDFPLSYRQKINAKSTEDILKQREARRKKCPICKGEGGKLEEIKIDGRNYTHWIDCQCIKQ